MSYLTTAEEIGMHKGIERLFARLLQGKFGQLPETYQERVHLADETILIQWSDLLLNANTLEDIFT